MPGHHVPDGDERGIARMSPSYSDTRETLLLRRDKLLEHLHERKVPGILSAGLSRREGKPVLVVLVRKGLAPEIPGDFEGTKVIVNHVTSASA